MTERYELVRIREYCKGWITTDRCIAAGSYGSMTSELAILRRLGNGIGIYLAPYGMKVSA